MNPEPVIVPFRDEHAAAFDRLNRAWLVAHDLLEDADLWHLEHPRASIIDRGGAIAVLVDGDRVIGTVGIAPHGKDAVEMIKLAVDPAARGRGLGRRLAEHAIVLARAAGARRLVLDSSTKLGAALALYESLGFVRKPLPPDTKYATADVYMELDLT